MPIPCCGNGICWNAPTTGMWISPAGIVQAIDYAVNLVGEDHVALGSDFDGTITSKFDVSELAAPTEEMIKADFSEPLIRKVMGENTVRFLMQNHPK